MILLYNWLLITVIKTRCDKYMNYSILILITFIGLTPISMASSTLIFEEVMIGFDGPVVKKPFVSIINSKDMLLEHWASEKLGENKTQTLLDMVNFSSQFIAVVQIGVRNTATGNMNIAEIEYNEVKTNVVVYVRVGVNERDCNLPKRQSLPYAIGVIDKPVVWPTIVNYYIGNFGDGCQEPKGIEFLKFKYIKIHLNKTVQ